MNVRNLYLWGILFISACALQSCQTEEMYVKEKGLGRKSGITTEYLKGAEAKRIANTLKTKFTNLGENGQQQSLSRTDYETIDYNNILLVVDSLGVKNYIFRVTNHPEDDYKTFHNLVMTDKNGELELTLMKYAMTDVFAQEYQEQLKKFQEFEGTVTAKGLLETNPCESIVSEFPMPINDSPGSSGGGGIGGTIDNPSGTNPEPIGGSEDTSCIEVDMFVLCSCGRSYEDWNAYTSSICGNGTNPGYDVTLVVTFTNICQMGINRCAPSGAIGVLEKDKPCPGDPLKKPKICPSSPTNQEGGTFGCTRKDPNRTCDGYEGKKGHNGLDLSGNVNDKVYNMYSGTVVSMRNNMGTTEYRANSLGNYIEIESVVNGETIRIKYCHMGNINVQIGSQVAQGAWIGGIGRSGNAGAKGVNTHLHLQSSIKVGDNFEITNPINFLSTQFDENSLEPISNCN